MLRDHRPYFLSATGSALERAYARHFLHPHFAQVGEGSEFHSPWHIGVFGGPVIIGRHVNVSASRQAPVSFAVWSGPDAPARIDVGDYSMLNPGTRIAAAGHVTLGRNTLLAPNVYITDCDWHDAYNRAYSLGEIAKVTLADNVWVGDGAMVCKGVTVGENAIVGARAVVTRDVPANTVVAGNPARVVRELDGTRAFISRDHPLRDPQAFWEESRRQRRAFQAGNTVGSYLRYLFFPERGD